jgi:hypothetical protein
MHSVCTLCCSAFLKTSLFRLFHYDQLLVMICVFNEKFYTEVLGRDVQV